jgi:hypothetical protein
VSVFEFSRASGDDLQIAFFEAMKIGWRGEYLDRWGLIEATSQFERSLRDSASGDAFAQALQQLTVQIDLLRLGRPLAVIRSNQRLQRVPQHRGLCM